MCIYRLSSIGGCCWKLVDSVECRWIVCDGWFVEGIRQEQQILIPEELNRESFRSSQVLTASPPCKSGCTQSFPAQAILGNNSIQN